VNNGFKDRVAVVGMGCTKFGSRWDASKEDLLLEAVGECLQDANLEFKDIDAFWFGTQSSEQSGLGLSKYLKIDDKPVTRLENYCCTGTDTFRNACYAVASGVYDVVMAIGMEKLKDSGYIGLTVALPDEDKTAPDIATPSMFATLAPGYAKKYGLSFEELRNVLMNISYKNHYNGAMNPKATFRKIQTMEAIARSPMVAGPYLTVMDCSGLSDGAACAIIMRTDMAQKHRKDPMYVKGINMIADSGFAKTHVDYDFTSLRSSAIAAAQLYSHMGIKDPAREFDLAEVHDCFTITELCLYEDLQFSKRGEGWQDLLNGKFNYDGMLPVNIDGGLKSFGHPIGASGIRMIYELWLQFHGKAGLRQQNNPRLGLTHNLGGESCQCMSGITVMGREAG